MPRRDFCPLYPNSDNRISNRRRSVRKTPSPPVGEDDLVTPPGHSRRGGNPEPFPRADTLMATWKTSGVCEPNPRHHCRINMKIIQSTPKATVFAGGGLISVLDNQGPIRWREVVPFGLPTPTLGRGNPETTRNFGPRYRSTRHASLPSRLGGSNNGKLWCFWDLDLTDPEVA